MEAVELVSKGDAFRSPKAACGEVDFDPPPARADDDFITRGDDLVIYQDRLYSNWRRVAYRRIPGLEVLRSLYALKPQLAVGRKAPGWLDASINLRGFQSLTDFVGENRAGVQPAIGGGI